MILKLIPPNVKPIVVALLGSLALIAADAALNADDIRVSVTVSSRVAADGFPQAVVEEFFLYDINQIARTKSLVQPPAIRSSGSKTIVSVIADALSLDNFTGAVQSALGIEMAQITATLSSEQGKTGFVLVGSSPTAGEFDFALADERSSVRDLLRRAAQKTMQHLDPYQTFLHRIGSDPDAAERRRIDAGLERAIADSDRPQDRQRRGLLWNLKGILHLLDGDVAKAEKAFAETIRTDPTLAVGYNNLAFVQVHLDRFADAADTIRRGLEPEPATQRPELLAALHTVWAVAAWGLGDTDTAERKFRIAIEHSPLSPGPHIYLAGMLEQLGRQEEAAREKALGEADLRYFREYPEVANLYFWMTPLSNVPLTRRSQPPPLRPAAPSAAAR